MLLGLTASCMVLGGCNTSAISGSSKATLHFVNVMSGGSGSLTFNINGGTTGPTVTFPGASTCQRTPAAATDFTVEPSGTSTSLATLSGQTLTAGGVYTVFATGSTTTPYLVLLTNTYLTTATGHGQIRVINAVGTGSPFDVYIGASGAALGTANQTNVTFNTSEPFVDVPAGSTEVQVTSPGTHTLLGTTTFTVNSGAMLTVAFVPPSTLGGGFPAALVAECQ
ncbi:MAG TPA: DUF4397 domain-containing protein [Gemmatimonadaceae bacterium]|nr:DUF4397 domain-containing protein [Gemmatimonadaceae bacterium]